MGCCVNPSDQSKEAWLFAHGELVDQPKAFDTVPEGMLPVCLVDNGIFSAAAVAFDADEFKSFTDKTDRRPKLWYQVETDALFEVSPLERYLNRKGR